MGELVGWLFEHSLSHNLFRLLLDENPLPRQEGLPRFAYYDTIASWVLDLSAQAFAALQARWQAEGLPTDLFYPENETRCVPYPGKGLLPALWRRLGVQKCYTPKQWEKAFSTLPTAEQETAYHDQTDSHKSHRG